MKLRLVVAASLATVMFLVPTAAAYAHICINAAKPDGAGNFGDVIIDADTGNASLPTNPGGQVAGGFADVYLDLDGNGSGDLLLVDDTFASAGELPAGAHNAGPGDDACDGVGVDNALACP